MGKPNRQGRHAKRKLRMRVLGRGPKLVARGAPFPAPTGSANGPAPPAGPAPPGAHPSDTTLPEAGPHGALAEDHAGDPALSAAARAEQLVSDALQAQMDGQPGVLAGCAAQLAERSGGRGGRDWQRAVERELLASLVRAVTAGWRQGWQPAEAVREIGRQFGARHGRLATDAVTIEMRNYARTAVDERWQAQLDGLGATAWWGPDEDYLERWCGREQLDGEAAVACALEVLFGFATLPRLGRLCPLPGTARQGAPAPDLAPGRPSGQRVPGRVRALLAKAEATELPEEAEELAARAQELLAARSIDDALLASGTGHGRQAVSGRRFLVDSPYELAKADLLAVVATADRCRAVWHKSLGLSTVLGFPGDLDAVELLFASLLTQATTAMVQAGSHRDDAGPAATRSFRQSFLASYAQRIGERLGEAAEAAQRQAVADAPDSGVLAALAARHRVVDEAVRKMFPDLAWSEPGPAPHREDRACGGTASPAAPGERRAAALTSP
jgi:Protein of unknown function (DUF2786)